MCSIFAITSICYRVFQLGFNAKKQLPMHIVAQSKSNQPETMAILFQALDKSFMYQVARDSNPEPGILVGLRKLRSRSKSPLEALNLLQYS